MCKGRSIDTSIPGKRLLSLPYHVKITKSWFSIFGGSVFFFGNGQGTRFQWYNTYNLYFTGDLHCCLLL